MGSRLLDVAVHGQPYMLFFLQVLVFPFVLEASPAPYSFWVAELPLPMVRAVFVLPIAKVFESP